MNTLARNFHIFKELDCPASDEFFLLQACVHHFIFKLRGLNIGIRTGLELKDFVHFPVGTYKVVKVDGQEILPAIGFTISEHREWFQNQQCPSFCTWRCQGKERYEIMRHIATCSFRPQNDPLKKFCTLWLAKMKRK
ncbi:hypothetical protein BT69DRAFT_1326703 [Atractiella rhizophila]|nr:hypothetical protein BT69DRAFT_1326703 [Atractiella rhizophila]